MRIRAFPLPALVVVLFAAGGVKPARADVAPPDLCTAPGQPCQNAGAITGAGQPGTCVATTCIKTMRDADGGFTHTPYDCNKCEAPDGGTAAAGGAAGGGGHAAGGAAGAGGRAGGGATGAAGATAGGGTTGAAGATATGGVNGTGGSSATGAAGKPAPGSSSGCAVAGSPAHPMGAGGALSLALSTILLARRRRRV